MRLTPPDGTVRLDAIPVRPNGSVNRPKGLWPYRPQARTRELVDRILGRYQMFADQDALPAGPRTVGYRLSETYRGEYSKADFPDINRVITRLTQAGTLPFGAVSDASAVTYGAGGWVSEAAFLRDAPGLFRRDRREGQPVVAEVYTEAKETLGLILRLGGERGVTVSSGSGSSGPGFARKAAIRALRRAVEHGQDTLILGLGDFDQHGIRNIMRPHIEHVAAFLYGTAGNEKVLTYEAKRMADTGCSVSFRHLGLTPEMALAQADTAELSQADQEAIAAYAASGTGLWDRDVALLAGVAKFELEVLDPAGLRALVVAALDGVLDHGELDRISTEEENQRTGLADQLAPLADQLDGGTR